MEAKKLKPGIQKVKWQDIRDRVAAVNVPFAKVIDKLKLTDKHSLYLARYPYGATIIKDGVFYVPREDGTTIPINDSRVSNQMYNQLNYNHVSIPVGIVLNHSIELFLRAEKNILPHNIRHSGAIFALWGALDPELSYHIMETWSMVAGAGGIFMLPKISDSVSFKKLSRMRDLKVRAPDVLQDHGKVMAQIAQSKTFPYSWHTELLFFSCEWLFQRENPLWIDFNYYLYRIAWDGSAFWRNKWLFDYTWHTFMIELMEQKVKVTPYIADIVKHLIIIALGALPGFGPTMDDEDAPIKGLQEDFYELYGLKKYAAILFVSRHFSYKKANQPVYWSLQFQTHIESTPRSKTASSVLTEMHEIHYLLTAFCEAALAGRLKGVINTPIYEMLKRVQFDFFHSEDDPEGLIRHSREMPLEDKRLLQAPSKYGKREFSAISPFVRGCVRISVRKS